MSPYRVPCWPPPTAPPRWTRFVTAVLAAAFVGAATTGAWLEARDARKNEAIWTQLALRASEEENARRIVELRGSRFDHRTDDDRAAILRAFSEERGTTRALPRCRCAAGDPLCSEIPGQTCAP